MVKFSRVLPERQYMRAVLFFTFYAEKSFAILESSFLSSSMDLVS